MPLGVTLGPVAVRLEVSVRLEVAVKLEVAIKLEVAMGLASEAICFYFFGRQLDFWK